MIRRIDRSGSAGPSLVLLAAAFLALPFAAPAEAADRPPNVIVFMIDDLGWTDAGCYGSDLYETPHIDKLAEQGVRFTDAYAACTVCSPTRAAMMTGMYPGHSNVTDWIPGFWDIRGAKQRKKYPLRPPDWTQRLEHEHTTIAEALGEAGYRTAHIGKWHLTPSIRNADRSEIAPYYPTEHGFAVNVAGNQWGAPGSYYWPYRRGNADNRMRARVMNFPAQSETKDKYLTDMLTDRAIGLMERWRDKPFFLHLAHYAVHTPIQSKKELTEYYKKKLKNGDYKHTRADYAAMVHSVDQSVGDIRAELRELGLSENTIIIFTSDNGGLEVRNGPTDNDPLRAGKGSAYEGGVRIPTIIRAPGLTPAGTLCDEPIITADFYPTILSLTGAAEQASPNQPIDGADLTPILREPDASLDREAIYWHYPHYHPGGAEPYSAVRAGDWRLVHFYRGDRVELYNLAEDVGETNDLSERRPEKAAELRERLNRWRETVDAQPPRPNPGYEEAG